MGKSNNNTRRDRSGQSSRGRQNNKPYGNKPPYKGKQASAGSKQDRREEEIADTAAAMSRSNPVDLYTKYQQFAHDAANLPFAIPLGANIPVDYLGTSGTVDYTVPGVMRIVFSPTVGVSNGYGSPMNQTSINYYARIRSTQKAFGDYDHQDLTMAVIAIDSAVMFHALGRKIYGLMRDMTPLNNYYPRALVNAHCMSYNATVKQLQDFRMWLNEYAIQIEQFAMPRNISLIDRHQWMCEGIYTDSPSTRAQSYVFVPRGFWQYNNLGANGSELKFVDFVVPGDDPPSVKQYTLDEFMQIGQSLIDHLSNDADISLMAGDLYAYYGGEVLTLPYIEEKYQILPRYDEIVLSQIENATCVGEWGYSPVISQNPAVNEGAIIFQPIVKLTHATMPYTPWVNLHKDSPTPDDVIEATRLVSAVGSAVTSDANELNHYVDICASEIVHWMDIYVVNPATRLMRFRRIPDMIIRFDQAFAAGIVQVRNILGDISYLQAFDWAPRVEILEEVNDNGIVKLDYIGSTWDIDNLSPVSRKYLQTIHQAAMYSLFTIASR